MHRTPYRRIFLSITVLVAMLVAVPVAYTPEAHAEGISATSITLEGTTIMEFTNESDVDMDLVRIWPSTGVTFKSFKAESGWTGELTPQGVLIFTSSIPLKPGELVKFGLKTDLDSSGINWRALDTDGNQIDVDKTFAEEIPKEVILDPPDPCDLPDPPDSCDLPDPPDSCDLPDPPDSCDLPQGILPESTFRIIPERPNVGSTIRVVGDSFGADGEFDFHIDTLDIGSFTTDENGGFVTTMKIPGDIEPGRIVFAVTDEEGQESEISIRIGVAETRKPIKTDIDLTVDGIPRVAHRGTSLDLSGTGTPEGAITFEMSTQDGIITNSRTAEINSNGNWNIDGPIIVPLNAPFGKYSITVTDGRDSIQRDMAVESNQVIIISASMFKFDRGETIVFNGTALPNMPISMILEDPFGNELISEELRTDGNGNIGFSYETTRNTPDGTYTLIATQGVEQEFIYAGLGQLPDIPVNLEFDKLNYSIRDTAIITLTGQASDIVNLLIVDPFDKPKGNATSVALQADGKKTYLLELADYVPGIYTAIVSKGTTANEERFSVGLETTKTDIEIKTTKPDYEPDDSILILGRTSPNVLLDLILTDPNGDVVKTKETYSDIDGNIAESTFRIPAGAEHGTWTITARSGSNFDTIEIGVFEAAKDGMSVQATTGDSPAIVGEYVNIHVTGSSNQVNVVIASSDGVVIGELEITATDSGEARTIWIIPPDTEPGIYTIKVSDAFRSAETTYRIG